MTTELAVRLLMARSMILSTILALPLASSSLAALIQMAALVGTARRARLSTLRALSYVSRRARASHSSTCCSGEETRGQLVDGPGVS